MHSKSVIAKETLRNRTPHCASKSYRLRIETSLLWRHNGNDCVPNHQPHHCLLNCLFGRRSKKTSKLRVTGLCVGNSPGTGEFPAQMASNAENVSIWWRHYVLNDYALSICKHSDIEVHICAESAVEVFRCWHSPWQSFRINDPLCRGPGTV